MDGSGNLYIAGGHRVRKVDSTGTITTVAGTGESGHTLDGDGGPATEALLYLVEGLAVDGAGNLYISNNHWVRKVDSAGTITTIAGTNNSVFSEDGGPAIETRLDPGQMAVDGAGNIWVSEDTSIRLLTPVLEFAHFANGASITSDLVLVNVAAWPIRPGIHFTIRRAIRSPAIRWSTSKEIWWFKGTVL